MALALLIFWFVLLIPCLLLIQVEAAMLLMTYPHLDLVLIAFSALTYPIPVIAAAIMYRKHRKAVLLPLINVFILLVATIYALIEGH